jgi:hypothetical protein
MRLAGILMAAALAVCAQPAHAGEAAPMSARTHSADGSDGEVSQAVTKEALADRRAAAPAPADGPFGAAVPLRQLAAWRGGADTVSNDMRLSGAVSGNTALNVASGMNSISSGSFSNAAGLPVAIQNSGANVLIQNATIINIQLQ